MCKKKTVVPWRWSTVQWLQTHILVSKSYAQIEYEPKIILVAALLGYRIGYEQSSRPAYNMWGFTFRKNTDVSLHPSKYNARYLTDPPNLTCHFYDAQ